MRVVVVDDDPDILDFLLRGLQAVWQTVATLTLLALKPFPHHAFEPT
jgi:DNA-binding response OmpR family regulator